MFWHTAYFWPPRRRWLRLWPVVGVALLLAATTARSAAGQEKKDQTGAAVSGARHIISATMGNGYRLTRAMVPMRDGIEIATDVVFPQGTGPWPVLLFRTPYGRTNSIEGITPFLELGIAYVTQDFRGLWDSKGEFDRFGHEISDGYDSVKWVAAQTWCNGKIAMRGGSGPGIGAKMAMLGHPPELVAVSTSVAASNMYHYCFYHGGVFRAQMNDGWFRGQGLPVQDWPRPRTEPLAPDEQSRTFAGHSAEIKTALHDVTGWFDIFLQSSLDDFVALGNNPHNRLVIGGTGHGKLDGLPLPASARPQSDSKAWLVHWLQGTAPQVLETPRVQYYLMGDVLDPQAPGNVWKEAHDWPVPHTPTPFYFHESGELSPAEPAELAALTYAYDPRDPVPTIGGANLQGPKGPLDQRPLKDRKDILRFITRPLEQPLEITGRVLVKLKISTDVTDTTFMAKLIDIYPDGNEALILDSAVMARYWLGLDQPQPLEPARQYALTIDLSSTALAFNKGHRVAVHISSSNSPRYEPHPNTYQAVDSYESSPVAHNTVHLGAQRSHILLPVISPANTKKAD